MKYLNSASIEWVGDQIGGLTDLAIKYGPKELLSQIEKEKPVHEESKCKDFQEPCGAENVNIDVQDPFDAKKIVENEEEESLRWSLSFFYKEPQNIAKITVFFLKNTELFFDIAIFGSKDSIQA